MSRSDEDAIRNLNDLPDATRRNVADFLKVSARPTRDPETLAEALRDSLALSALGTSGARC